MTHPLFGRYIPIKSFVHSLDPRTKMIIIAVFICALFFTSEPCTYVLWSLLPVFAARLSHIRFNVLFSSCRPVVYLAFCIFILHACCGSVNAGIVASLRLLLMVMFASLLNFTTTPSKIAASFGRGEAAMMVTIGLCFVPTMFEETERIIAAQKSRGADFETGGLVRRAKMYICVIIPLFAVILRRADALSDAMESRGYVPGKRRSALHPLHWSAAETLSLVFVLSVVLSIIYFERNFLL